MEAASACWSGHICAAHTCVNRLFAIMSQSGVDAAPGAASDDPRWTVDGGCARPVQWPKLLIECGFSSALNVSAHRFGLSLDPLHPVLHQIPDGDDSTDCSAFDNRQMA